jgi:hypothetical protein
MTPDWALKPTNVPYANFGNPQSLNLYSYVQNNPTTMGDPDGHQDCGCQLFVSDAQAASIRNHVEDYIDFVVKTTPQDLSHLWNAVKTGANNFAANYGAQSADPMQTATPYQQSEKETPAATQPVSQPKDKEPQPLVGNNPRDGGTRTNTDLPGGHQAATETFGEQTAGQNVRTDQKTGHQVSEDGSRLRRNPDGTARVDLPNRGTKPNGETIHFNNPDPKPPEPKKR